MEKSRLINANLYTATRYKEHSVLSCSLTSEVPRYLLRLYLNHIPCSIVNYAGLVFQLLVLGSHLHSQNFHLCNKQPKSGNNCFIEYYTKSLSYIEYKIHIFWPPCDILHISSGWNALFQMFEWSETLYTFPLPQTICLTMSHLCPGLTARIV